MRYLNHSIAIPSLIILLLVLGCNSTDSNDSPESGPITPGTYVAEFPNFRFELDIHGFSGFGSTRQEMDLNADGSFFSREYITSPSRSISDLLQTEIKGKWKATSSAISSFEIVGRRRNALTLVWDDWSEEPVAYESRIRNVNGLSFEIETGGEGQFTLYQKSE